MDYVKLHGLLCFWSFNTMTYLCILAGGEGEYCCPTNLSICLSVHLTIFQISFSCSFSRCNTALCIYSGLKAVAVYVHILLALFYFSIMLYFLDFFCFNINCQETEIITWGLERITRQNDHRSVNILVDNLPPPSPKDRKLANIKYLWVKELLHSTLTYIASEKAVMNACTVRATYQRRLLSGHFWGVWKLPWTLHSINFLFTVALFTKTHILLSLLFKTSQNELYK